MKPPTTVMPIKKRPILQRGLPLNVHVHLRAIMIGGLTIGVKQKVNVASTIIGETTTGTNVSMLLMRIKTLITTI